jgi:hypothetical protein
LRGLGATSGLLLFYLLVPAGARTLPAFPVLWACLAADVWAARWPRAKIAAVMACAAIGVACLTVGRHTALDVAAACVAYGSAVRGAALWSWMCRRAEGVANSWREWRVGPVRFMSHGVYAAVGGAAGAGIAVWLAGMSELWWVLGLTLGAQAGAALWAQFVEGSPQLLRPYGYFGSVLGVILLAAGAGLAGHDPWLLLGSMAIGGCVTQVLGRVRCLVQGCCHGRPIDAPWGIRHTHPRSRVVRLSAFGGQRLHPTALYSMVWMLGVFAALLRLWLAGVPRPFISGSYLLLVGLGRFVEEHYRGEPQTAEIGGLRLYQWLAIVFVVGGAALTAVGGPATPRPLWPEVRLWPVLALLLVTTYAAYGVDFPGSNRRFSRLV